ncbi:putative LPS assembly protein LptD [Flavobacterium sp. SUN052]|uniref:putative LPS assembly protein LptD n=1 Tax=Flavobacterium sp. SUN052 TaxID=3002441 RepID=UPI00237D4E5B|nr:putative LPS assembly protein LptD [Flavobacterium sp. SUN052]MEC4005131.1 putative LPS assembly protein LptD [Flavobacterium sp. SUN052]
MAGQKSSHIFTKIAFKPLRTNLFYIVLSAYFLTIGSSTLFAQETPKSIKPVSSKNQNIKTEKEPTTEAKSDGATKEKLTEVKVDTSKKFKSVLEGKVKYRAKKYAKFDQKKKLITLYDGAELNYLDYELKSGIIVFDYQKNEVYAGRLKDSAGNYTQLPVFKQGSNVIEPDSIRFNYKTKKALVWNSRTTQQELNIKSKITKKENDSVYFMKGARLTTSKDIDDPEYYFLVGKMKLVPGKKVVVGLTNLWIENVPTPIALPFAFFPITQKSHSGVIPPSFGQNNTRGYALQNGGYYFALSDKYDLAVMGDYYTNGSYATRFESSYANKYKFSGTVNLRFENLITSERGYPDYAKSKIYNIQWSHTKDAKSNPNSRFSASVNLGSSKYFQQSINLANIGSTLNNTLSSSVSFSKTFNSVPQVNLSLTATHSQNTQSKQINMTLPNLQLSVDRIFPFAPKDGTKKGFIKNINLQYNLKGENQIVTTDTLFFKKEMFKNAKVGFQHSIPLSTNFKIFKYFSASTSVNYNEVWYLKTIRKDFVVTSLPPATPTGKVVSTDVNGFDAFRTYSFSNSIGTTIYGTYDFGKNNKIQSIRHVMRPSVSHSYGPSFAKYYDTYASDASGNRAEYTRFEGGIYGAPGKTYSNNIGFSLSNTFEAKVRDKDSTATEPKKIMLLNNLNISTSYDLAADSLRLAPIRISGGTLLLKQKMNVNFAATLDPYALDSNNVRINTFNIDNGGGLFRMTSANMTMNYSFTSTSDKDKKEKNVQGSRNGGREDDLFGSNNELNDSREDDNLKQKDDDDAEFTGFYNAKIPWDFNVAYSLTYSNATNERKISSNSLMISANTDLTPKWKIGVSTGYDFVKKGVTFTQLRLNRDLLSWNMSFNWNPFGTNSYWGFFIGIKAGILKDIKWDKRTQPDRTLR